jgi:ABC-type Fe3+/spermidine/putrescine transport system ATPase subunit
MAEMTGSRPQAVRTARGAAREMIVRFDAVAKLYNGHPVLRDFRLDMRRGEFLTLLGPSGCGKTTSLNLVAGLLKPDGGTIYLRGLPANATPPRRREIGLVFQSYALFPHMTVFENVAYGLRIRSVAKAELRSRVQQMLDLVRLPNAADKYPSQLSGGMQQRVALARALVTRPDLLLLDEPLSNLDAALRKEMQVEIRRIHDELGVSTLLVTHSQEEALVMSDRIAVMRQGRIESLDTPDGVYNRPPTTFVCGFVGDVNLFESRVTSVDGNAARLESDGIHFVAPAGGATQGQRLTVAIRPENVAVRGSTAEGFPGAVTSTIFKGQVVEYKIRLGNREIAAVALPSASKTVFSPGSAVRIGFPPEWLMLLPTEEADNG